MAATMPAKPLAILPSRDGDGLSLLSLVMAVMVFLAGLSISAGVAVSDTVDRWRADLESRVTVQISPDAGDTGRAVARVLEILRADPAVAEARALTPEELHKLLAPWLGAQGDLASLPVPQLVDVAVKPGMALDTAALAQRLRADVPAASVDDHRAWLTDVLQLARSIQAMAAGIAALIMFATIAVVVFATRAGLSMHGRIVDVLHVIGARDGFIAGVFARHFLRVGLEGGLIGIGLAAVALTGLDRVSAALSGALITAARPTGEAFLVLLILPFIAGLLAMLTARMAVTGALRKML